MVRPQSRRPADPERSARRERCARCPVDALRADGQRPARVRRPCGHDPGRARPRRLLHARAPQRARGSGRRRAVGARLHEPDGGTDPRRQARLGGRHIAPGLGAAEARGRSAKGRYEPQASRRSTRDARATRSPHRPRPVVPELALCGLAASVRAGRRRGGHACPLARPLVGRSSASTAAGSAGPSGLSTRDIAVAMVNPGEERRFLAAGFVPTPARSASSASASPRMHRSCRSGATRGT